jgi:signal transduction histidine kinase
MSSAPLRVLHLEDVEHDAELVEAALEEGGIRCEIVRAETENEFTEALEHPFDLIIADYSLPSFDGMRALELARKRRPDVPFLFVTGALKDDSAVESLRRGATDFIVKERLSRLTPAVQRALREFDERRESARVQADNARLYRQLENAVRAREDMLAVVSHDLRNPLGTIMASAALLRCGTPPERVSDLIEKIARSANRMDRLIGDLLDLARIDGSTLTLERRPLDVADVIRESTELYAEVAEKKSITLVATPSSTLIANGDRERVVQILSNIIGNALKFTPAGGRVTISAERDGDMVRISTTDTGRGIPKEHVAHIFDRYWRAGHDRSSVGLGLSIVKGLVEAQGGEVSASSEEGRGATVSFTLPSSSAKPEAKAPARPVVLVVDDDADIRQTIAETLTNAGYETLTAVDGAEALERLRSASAQLIILDLMMPRMDGIEFRLRQREDPALAAIPTVLVTAFDPPRDGLIPLEPAACVRKPVDIDALLDLVRRFVDGQSEDVAQTH